MRTYSTPQSALNGEITKLAIIECVLSAALYIGLGVYFGTFKYLAVAVVFAPLMLFRTEISADWGLKHYRKANVRFAAWATVNDEASISRDFSMVVALPAIGTAIRFVSTVYWAVRRPLHTLKDVPHNWLRQCFCTDFAHPPEIVPKEAAIHEEDDNQVLSFTFFLRNYFDNKASCT